MQYTAIIPARLKSERLKHKLLIEVGGKSILQHVYERVEKSQFFDRVIIAVDSKRMYSHAMNFASDVRMTSRNHKSGTDRIAEIALKIRSEYIVNIQGDEPLIRPEHLFAIKQTISKKNVDIASLYCSFKDEMGLNDPSNVKVVTDKNDKALYFSRSVIPFPRRVVNLRNFKHHIGMYAFRRKALLKLSNLEPSSLEHYEGLEQLRWLENGFSIDMQKVASKTISIDTAQDLKQFEKIYKS